MLIVSCIISILNPPSPVSVKPELHIAIGMDSNMAVARMRDYAKQYGGNVYCQTHVGYSCSYTSPYGEKTSIAIRAELTGIGQSPVKGTVTSVNKSWDN
jgi:hypothetical protein